MRQGAGLSRSRLGANGRAKGLSLRLGLAAATPSVQGWWLWRVMIAAMVSHWGCWIDTRCGLLS